MIQRGWGSVRWVKADGVGSWIEVGKSDRGYPQSVRDLVPDRFEAYARLLHPFWLDGRELRWSELAAQNESFVTRSARVEDLLATTLEEARHAGLTIGGSIAPQDWGVLGAVLQRHSSSDAALFGLWEGRGKPSSAPEERQLSLLCLPNRNYFLAEVPFTEWSSSGVVMDIVNLAWPLDRAWFLNCDIDACATYIGGSGALINELNDSGQLELVPAELDDPVWSY